MLPLICALAGAAISGWPGAVIGFALGCIAGATLAKGRRRDALAITKSFCFFAAGATLLAVGTREIAEVRGLIHSARERKFVFVVIDLDLLREFLTDLSRDFFGRRNWRGTRTDFAAGRIPYRPLRHSLCERQRAAARTIFSGRGAERRCLGSDEYLRRRKFEPLAPVAKYSRAALLSPRGLNVHHLLRSDGARLSSGDESRRKTHPRRGVAA